ncbi:TIGR04282 family arsenosugar biosynthesis glycosyltransferase [Nocardioides sambongensis]|uniref:TIGR04282 family arsenosugar biosynthesis glycosyltransferase n=1 Tax=Nocardioides sambongensis TaxID=2589074 RepID=UPI00112A2CFD|nr:TIGR04282 family arsenosugar biosynthesis glycosyltransferase [Nocardioides sambongensis]
MTADPTVLVVAKAPVPGRVKTRLAATVGDAAAARVAAASLLDTLDACTGAVGPDRCRLALAGDLDDAVEAAALRSALAGWSVAPQRGSGLGARIAAAFEESGAPTIQIGMDTPQVTPALLHQAAARLADHDAVLGAAEDGGWWLLGLTDPAAAAAVAGVPMSTEETGRLTHRALTEAGLQVGTAPVLRDIDEVADLAAVAALVGGSRTARAAEAVLR